MTGKELLNILQGLTEEQLAREISTEGCDCDGDVGSVSLDEPGYIYLERERIVPKPYPMKCGACGEFHEEVLGPCPEPTNLGRSLDF